MSGCLCTGECRRPGGRCPVIDGVMERALERQRFYPQPNPPLPPGAGTFPPVVLTEERVRQIVREELEKKA